MKSGVGLKRSLRRALGITFVMALLLHVGAPAVLAQSAGKIRFGVGPLQPTPAETKKTYEGRARS